MPDFTEILKIAVQEQDWKIICGLYKNITGEELPLPQPPEEEEPVEEDFLTKEYDLESLRENSYTEKVMFINSKKKIFTDKNLFNFLYCPIIYNLFPDARIIHCTRNPLDNILSIYRTNFLNQSLLLSNLDHSPKLHWRLI